MRLQILPNEAKINTKNPALQQLSQQFHPEDIQLFYHMTLRSVEELSLAPTLAIGFEMLLLRMYTFRPDRRVTHVDLAYANAKINSLPSISSEPINPNQDWAQILSVLNLNGMARSAIEHTEFVEKHAGIISLRLAKKHQSIFTSGAIKRIEEAFSSYYKEPLTIKLIYEDQVNDTPAQNKKKSQETVHNTAHAALLSDPVFVTLQETFSGELIKSSVESVKNVIY